MADIGSSWMDFLHQYQDVVYAVLIFLGSFLVLRFAYGWTISHFSRILRRQPTDFDQKLLKNLGRSVQWGILILCLYLAAGPIHLLDQYRGSVNDLFRILWIVWGIYVAVGAINAFFIFHIEKIEKTGAEDKTERTVVANVNKVANAVIYIIGFLLILRALNVDITAMVTALGIGGLAFALAFQSSLTNYLAGIYITTDRSVRLGDYIELEGGRQGYVEKIGWRSTRIRTVLNNIVVIPNAKLSEMVLTNYYQPQAATSIAVPCGVAYGSDLNKVEKLAVDTAALILQETGHGSDGFPPFVRYKNFGESNIEFLIFLQLKDYVNKEFVVHRFVKELSKRFTEEGVEIAYPTRNVYMKQTKPTS